MSAQRAIELAYQLKDTILPNISSERLQEYNTDYWDAIQWESWLHHDIIQTHPLRKSFVTYVKWRLENDSESDDEN